MIGIGLWMLGAFGPISTTYDLPSDIHRALGWLLVILIGIAGLMAVVRSIQPPEELRIGMNGVYWSRYSNDLIPWTELTRVAMRRYGYSWSFVLHLRDRSRLRPRGIQSVIIFINRCPSAGDIWIEMNAMDRRYDEALLAFETFSSTGVVIQKTWRNPRVG